MTATGGLAKVRSWAGSPEPGHSVQGRDCRKERVSFEQHIRPLFREGDRQSMRFAFDLWAYDDVADHADAILGRVQAGTMPCDGAWPAERLDVLRRWVESGKPT